MTSIKSYKITSQAQLIDLNGESTNFDIHFHVQSDNKEPFEISVVDQQKLDFIWKFKCNRQYLSKLLSCS
jgi:hypothetical protein